MNRICRVWLSGICNAAWKVVEFAIQRIVCVFLLYSCNCCITIGIANSAQPGLSVINNGQTYSVMRFFTTLRFVLNEAKNLIVFAQQ